MQKNKQKKTHLFNNRLLRADGQEFIKSFEDDDYRREEQDP